MNSSDVLEPGDEPTPDALEVEVVEQDQADEAPAENAIPKLAENASPRDLLAFKAEVLKWEADRLLDERNGLTESLAKVDSALETNADSQTAYRKALAVFAAMEESA